MKVISDRSKFDLSQWLVSNESNFWHSDNFKQLCFISSVILGFSPQSSSSQYKERDSCNYAKMFYYNCCGQKYWLTILHKLRFLHCFCHFIETKNGKTILWMPQQFSPCITQHTAYINCAFVLRVQRWLFLCTDLIGLIVEFYRLGEHARVFSSSFPINIFLRLF